MMSYFLHRSQIPTWVFGFLTFNVFLSFTSLLTAAPWEWERLDETSPGEWRLVRYFDQEPPQPDFYHMWFFTVGEAGEVSFIESWSAEAGILQIVVTEWFSLTTLGRDSAARGDNSVGFDENRGQVGFVLLGDSTIEGYFEALEDYATFDDVAIVQPVYGADIPLALSPFWDVPAEENGFKETTIGWLIDEQSPWIQHLELGWLWMPEITPQSPRASSFAWHPEAGWLWLLPGAWQYAYSFEEEAWLWFDAGTGAFWPLM